MNSDEVRKPLERMYNEFSSVFDADVRGTFLNDIAWFDSSSNFTLNNLTTYTPTPLRLRSLLAARDLSPSRILIQKSIKHLGMTFSTSQVSPGNSRVIIGSVTSWVASKITDIFAVPIGKEQSMEIFLVVETYARVSTREAKDDPYKRYPHAGRLFRNEVHETSMVKAQDVLCHFAGTPVYVPKIKGEALHVLPLLRVRKLSCSGA